MNTPSNQEFGISAKHLGPILSFTDTLSAKGQNLIFARNGTGKSFLSRAFWYLDLCRTIDSDKAAGRALDDAMREAWENAARNLISEEASNGQGEFSFSRGGVVMGSLRLERAKNPNAQLADTIFHVFSDEFIHRELRKREYNPDGEIENQIVADVGSDNIQLREMQAALERDKSNRQATLENLQKRFNDAKRSELVSKARVHQSLREYRNLTFDDLLESTHEEPPPPSPDSAAIREELRKLLSIPEDPAYPKLVDHVEIVGIDLDALEASLRDITPPAEMDEETKRKIVAHHEFYRTGVDIVNSEHRDTCPFCEQDITAPGPRSIIAAYMKYFQDKEEQHRKKLREFNDSFESMEGILAQTSKQLDKQKSEYDSLRHHVPSKQDANLIEVGETIQAIHNAITTIKDIIEKKKHELSVPHSLPKGLLAHIDSINEIIKKNNSMITALNEIIRDSSDERKNLQRKACHAFKFEFIIGNWDNFKILNELQIEINKKEEKVEILKQSHLSGSARDRVASTFMALVREFFGKKYTFDEKEFVLKRGGKKMERGEARTLSDGEKAVIAFCYFVACIHKKMVAESDYQKLFLVFDDPVTSMSYDFVFAIAQTLRNLNLSVQGGISLNPGQIDGNKYLRPNLLILTHNSYFFNICHTNGIVHEEAAFVLYPDDSIDKSDGDSHRLDLSNKYMVPFQEQLKHVYKIVGGGEPDHTTANAARSTVEAIGKFCQPDKYTNLDNFIRYLAREKGIIIKSVILNWHSHGNPESVLVPDQLKRACEEALEVVKHYTPGQFEMLRSPKSKET